MGKEEIDYIELSIKEGVRRYIDYSDHIYKELMGSFDYSKIQEEIFRLKKIIEREEKINKVLNE